MKKNIWFILIPLLLVILVGCSNGTSEEEQGVETKEASYFETETLTMLGEENKAGFILSENQNLLANKPNKYMWHLWGNEDFEEKDFKVTGVNLDTNDEEDIFTSTLSGPNNGADAHVPTHMNFPSEGTWELSVFVDGEIFEKISVEVL
ncbi:hypothetical protein ACDX78_04490 [Virgibacillus oceani]